jgi:uncharacterized circularly permuted ATP-grasp superfamily protein/uncharacterized alpha-E superfamily protein
VSEDRLLGVGDEGAAAARTRGLFSAYEPLPGCRDEMAADAGTLHPHWEYLAGAMGALGDTEIERRNHDLRRLLRENGVTYNFYEENDTVERPWSLDPIPVLLTSADWSEIEQGLAQRAELLDLVLRDLYGPRKLLKRGLLPPELIFGHPGFLRACAGTARADGRWLTICAADLARGPDGRLWVIGDRIQAPSGAGYALEARTALSRTLPSLYRDSHVHRLALFFRTLRGTLASLAPGGREDPRIVLLTPGPGSETFFEHAYLASYLGYPLVQGSDLTVRDERVWLKTLDGLTPVDVILRRVDDPWCDPLELRPDSLLGVAALLQAVRRGNVVVANPLGTSILENPGLMPFLPALARALLDEDLKQPSATTWWCGDPDARRHVLDKLDELVVKPVFPHRVDSTIFAAALAKSERDELKARIRAHPERYVAQERIALSTTPVLRAGRLEPRPFVLRSFAVASESGYLVMPGGLGRVSSSSSSFVTSNQLGGVGKDVWVLASEPERQVSLLAPVERPVVVRRGGDEVPGRVADDLFWLGRYSERAEAITRLLREILLRLLAAERSNIDGTVPLLLRALTVQSATYPGFAGEDAEERIAAPEAELLQLILDPRRVGGLRFNIDALARAGRAVRDRLSSDTSRVIGAIDGELARPCDLAAARESLQRLIQLLAGFVGLTTESMSRGQGWRFLQLGRSLERGLQTIALLRGVVLPAGPLVVPACEAVLGILHSVKTYRRRYRSRIQMGAVLDLVLLDESNPRSLAFQLVGVEEHVIALTHDDESGQRSRAERLALEALTTLRLFDVASVADPEDEDAALELERLLTRVAASLTGLAHEIATSYFQPADRPQQMVRFS